MVLGMSRVRIAARAACVTALTTAIVAATAVSATVASHDTATGQVTIAIRPGAIRLPGAATRAPVATALCAKKDGGIACYQPDQLRTAYHLPAVYAKKITGKGETIAIVDSFGSPTIKSDLATFDRQFGYPAPPTFTIIAPAGKIPAFKPNDSDMTSWAGETTLDVEYAHALAPGASILLVETPVAETEGTTGFPQIVAAEEYVINHGLAQVISQSFGATEETFASSPQAMKAQIGKLRSAYVDAAKHHVTVLAASGDAGATDLMSNQSDYYIHRVTSWPDSDPYVTAVGGTRLVQTGGSYTSVAWNDTYNRAFSQYLTPSASGGGRSAVFARPSWQNAVKAVTLGRRGVPDISMSAACNGAVNVYSSYPPSKPGWSLTCGTSEATPEFAAIVALADQVASQVVGHHRQLGLINPTLYALAARHAPGLVDVTSGNNTVSFYQGTALNPYTVPGFQARKGYDLVTGLGTVNAASFVYELAGVKGY
jgi:subtilase family serine protease